MTRIAKAMHNTAVFIEGSIAVAPSCMPRAAKAVHNTAVLIEGSSIASFFTYCVYLLSNLNYSIGARSELYLD